MENNKILSVQKVNKYFKARGVLKHALNDVSFDVEHGDFLGIIGESGSGKTTLGKAIIRLLDVSGGNIEFLDKNISSKSFSKNKKQWLADNMQMIFQDPLSSLNPNMNIVKLIAEPLEISKEIVKQVKEVVDLKVIFNSYYKYHFLLNTKKVVIENSFKFYETYNQILKNEIKRNQQFKFTDPNSWVNSYNDVEKLYDDILADQRKLIPFLENIIGHNSTVLEKSLVRLEKKQLDQTFLDFYEYKTVEKSLLKPIEDAQRIYETKKEELDAFKRESKYIASKKMLKNDLKDYTLTHEFNRTNASLAKTRIENLRFTLLADQAKIKKRLINNAFQYKYIDENHYLEGVQDLFDYLDQIYLEADEEINRIETQNVYQSSIDTFNSKYAYKYVNAEIYGIFGRKLAPKFAKLNSLTEKKSEKFLATKTTEVNLANQKYEALKSKMQDSIQKDLQRKERENQKIIANVNTAFNKYKAIYDRYIDGEYATLKNKINKLKKTNSELKKVVYRMVDERLKKLLALRPASLNQFSTREKIVLLRNNKKTFKSQISLKKSAMATIDWEYDNIMQHTKIYEQLFSTSRQILKFHKPDLIKLLTLERIYKALESVGLKKEHAYRYPHEFSGGQRQRIVIARALINNPKLIIADEAISALDVSVQAQVINIMKEFSVDQGMTFLFIAHDLSMVRNICNKVIIMHNGRIVEKGLVSKIFEKPIHPYTKALFKAIPELNKMHVDLAMFNVNHDYDKHYTPSNVPQFYEITPGHEVLATEKQYQKWAK